MAGWILSFTWPQLGAKEALNWSRVPLSYCWSPSVATTVGPIDSSRSEVAVIRHAVAVPSPLLKFPSRGSQAMSPAATSTGSPPAGPVVVVEELDVVELDVV